MLSTHKSLTEDVRSGHFGHVDQNEWTSQAYQITDKLYSMLLAGASFLELNDFARIQRFELARKLHPEESDDFGMIRRARGCDTYELGWFNDVTMDKKVFIKLRQILSDQKSNFNKNEIEVIELRSGYQRAAPGFRFYCYTQNQTDLMNNTFYSLLNTKTDTEVIIKIETQYSVMNGYIYLEMMRCLNGYLDLITMTKAGSNAAIFFLGLLAYDLCRVVAQKRGSAAINSFILRAIARSKEFDLTVLRLRDLPFDIYAQVQHDRLQYAIELAKSVKLDFQLDHECIMREDFLPKIIAQSKEREEIKDLIYDAITIINRFLGHKLSFDNKNLFMPHRANALALRTTLEKLVNINDISNRSLKEKMALAIQKNEISRNLKYGLHKIIDKLDLAVTTPQTHLARII